MGTRYSTHVQVHIAEYLCRCRYPPYITVAGTYNHTLHRHCRSLSTSELPCTAQLCPSELHSNSLSLTVCLTLSHSVSLSVSLCLTLSHCLAHSVSPPPLLPAGPQGAGGPLQCSGEGGGDPRPRAAPTGGLELRLGQGGAEARGVAGCQGPGHHPGTALCTHLRPDQTYLGSSGRNQPFQV